MSSQNTSTGDIAVAVAAATAVAAVVGSMGPRPAQPTFRGWNLSCYLCGYPHHVYRCPGMLSMCPAGRAHIVRELGLCTNCLKREHHVYWCPSEVRCALCGMAHNTLLHPADRRGSAYWPRPYYQNLAEMLRFFAGRYGPDNARR